jgi:hypothetical protein
MSERKIVALTPDLTQNGKTDETADGDGILGIASSKLFVSKYSLLDPSGNNTVYISGLSYEGIPIILA